MLWACPPWQGVANSIREGCAKLTLRQIEGVFSAELVAIASKNETRESDLVAHLGQRRARATVWLERVAWNEVPPLKLGEILERLRVPLSTESTSDWDAIVLELDRVGWRLNGYGPIVGSAWPAALPTLTDAKGISDELARLDNAISTGDVHGAVGYAKNLVEGTAKYAYSRSEGHLPGDPKFRPLVLDVGQQLLAQVPVDAPDSLADFIGSLTASVVQIGPLRNRIEGTAGHGAPIWDPWLLDAHSRLLAEVGVAWARYVLTCVNGESTPDTESQGCDKGPPHGHGSTRH